MRLKLQLAIEAVNERGLSDAEERNIYGEGFLAGFDKAMELSKKKLKERNTDETNQSVKVIIRRIPVISP